MTNLVEVFQKFLTSKSPEQQNRFRPHQDLIIAQALSNRGLKKKETLSADEEELLLEELEDIVYLSSSLPSFIGGDGSIDKLIDPHDPKLDKYAIKIINAQNLLKHLLRGVRLAEKDGAHYSQSYLAHDDIFNIYFNQRNPVSMRVMRQQMQIVFNNAWHNIKDKSLSGEDLRQYEIFQSNLMSSYPFWDPEVDCEEVHIPQKIKGNWELVSYKFTRFDVSPKSGPLSWVLEERDRMYSYAMVPNEGQPDAISHLLFMGTTYPGGQGSDLADLYNFCPHSSLGEGHNMTEVYNWLEKQIDKSVQVTGHSKGAVMATLVAAMYPNKIIRADCLNPLALAEPTLNRLAPDWNKLSPEKRPRIDVFTQVGDPAFPLEKGFLKGTNIYLLIPETKPPAINVSGPLSIPIPELIRKTYESHIHLFSGRAQALLIKVNTEQENNSIRRMLFNDIKYVLNWLYFPGEYLRLFIKITARRMGGFFEENQEGIIAGLIGAALLTGGILAFTGAWIPLVALIAGPILAQLGIALTPGVGIGLAVLSPVLAYGSFKIACELTLFLAKSINKILFLTTHIAALALGSLLFAVKSAGNILVCSSSSDDKNKSSPVRNRNCFFNEPKSTPDRNSELEMTNTVGAVL